MKTVNQRWAAQILQQVQKAAGKGDVYKRKYGSMAHKLPVLVRTAGLVQALSFVEARGENPQRQLLDDLAATLGYQDGRAGLLAESRNAELSQYMYVTKQVLHALLWYKRFAQSVLDVQTAEADDNTPENTQYQEEEALTNEGAA